MIREQQRSLWEHSILFHYLLIINNLQLIYKYCSFAPVWKTMQYLTFTANVIQKLSLTSIQLDNKNRTICVRHLPKLLFLFLEEFNCESHTAEIICCELKVLNTFQWRHSRCFSFKSWWETPGTQHWTRCGLMSAYLPVVIQRPFTL